MNVRKVLIFGSTGQLGSDLVQTLQAETEYEVVPVSHEEADCTDLNSVQRVVANTKPHILLNSAAYVRVDECESNAEQGFRVNSVGAFNIARAAAEIGAVCVYFSTDYVFDGAKPDYYDETDAPNPINVYGTSKLAGEYLVRQTTDRHLIVRVASLFGKKGARGKRGNFLETVFAKAQRGEPIRVVDDIRVSPTYSRDAAAALVVLLGAGAEGIIHLTNEGACSWYDFATEALRLAGSPVAVQALSTNQYPTRARRPINSALRSIHPQIHLRPWRDALKAYLVETDRISRV